MLQASKENFQKQRIELEVLYGKKINALNKTTENLAKPLYEYLRATKKIEVHLDFCLSLCAVCEQPWKTGDFAKEKMLLIPKPNEQSTEKPKPVRVTIPRVVCPSCSQTLSQDDRFERKEDLTACTLLEAWRTMVEKTNPKAGKPEVKVFVAPSHNIENPLSSFRKNTTTSIGGKSAVGFDPFNGYIANIAPRSHDNGDCENRSSQQQVIKDLQQSPCRRPLF